MKLQQVLGRVRKAVDDYKMIDEGDRIAVGISGGKDSLTLLYALAMLRKFYPLKFDIEAVTVDLGFRPGADYSPIKAFCEALGVNYTIVPTEIAEIVFNARKEPNPCALCATLRKGALNNCIEKLNCNKVAYAHHKDDIVETFLMSLIYEGRLHSFSPVTFLDRKKVTVIRPLMYMNESDVIGFKNLYNLPVVKNPCPADGVTKREYVKELTRHLNKESAGASERIFTAVINGNLPGWPIRETGKRSYPEAEGKPENTTAEGNILDSAVSKSPDISEASGPSLM